MLMILTVEITLVLLNQTMKELIRSLSISQLFQVSIHYNNYVDIKITCFFYSLACLQGFSGGLLWPTNRRNRLVTKRCSTLHPSFRSGVAISRKCNDDGTWGPVDYSNCTALNDAIPTLLISFIVSVSYDDAQPAVNNVSSVAIFVQMHVHTYIYIYIEFESVAWILIIASIFLDYTSDNK